MEKQDLRQAYLQREKTEQEQIKPQAAVRGREALKCPKCGTVNDVSAAFCENCGHALGQRQCPHCHTQLTPGADICEKCHQYVMTNTCSFCGSSIGSEDHFCPECGMSREGIICPVCHASNIFSICTNCGTPLTDSARLEVAEVRQTPQYRKMRALSNELEVLFRQTVATSEEQKARLERCDDIRRRVLQLLEEDGVLMPRRSQGHRIETEEELAALILKKRAELQELLSGMTARMQANAAVARRYVLARKPPLSRLGWRCNFKNELHRGPQECACPQMGGTWVVTDGRQEIELNAKK